MKPEKHKPATRDEAKYVAVRVGRCDPYCVLPANCFNGRCLVCENHCAQGELLEYTEWPLPPPIDWTHGAGRANSSRGFEALVIFIDELIRQSGHDLINGRTENVARLIATQLAHVVNMAGPNTKPRTEERESIHEMIGILRKTAMHPPDRLHRDRVICVLERLLK